MIAVYEHAYIYMFTQRLRGIRWNRFLDIAVELLPIHDWELIIMNVRIGWIYAEM